MIADITEKTKVPISLVFMIIGVVVWFIRLEGRVDVQASQISALQQAYLSQSKTLERIDHTTIKIAAEMNIDTKFDDNQ